MNAPLLQPVLTARAVDNIALLQALGAVTDPDTTMVDVAAQLGRDQSNLRKTATVLEAEGYLMKPEGAKLPSLTDAGRAALDAWDRANGDAPAGGEVQLIQAHLLDPWPGQPRTQFDLEFVKELSLSIGDEGVLQPLTVRPVGDRFQVVIGENRRRASIMAVDDERVPRDFAVPCKVRQLDDGKAFEIAVAENVHRDDLHWMDEAKAMLRLAEMGRSGAEIGRIFGGLRGKRSVQDYTKIARELPDDVLALAYLPAKLPNGQPNPQCLTYTKARDMVGDKSAAREKPALDLTPKLKLALLELIYAAAGWAPVQQGQQLQAVLHKPPTGGPLGTLSERKLIEFGFDTRLDGRPVVARIRVSPELYTYLGQMGWNDQPGTALVDARAAVVGELQAGVITRAEEFVTPELNRPAAQAAPTLAAGDDGVQPGEGWDDDDDGITDAESAAISREMRESREAEARDLDSDDAVAGETDWERELAARDAGLHPPPKAAAPVDLAPLPDMLAVVVAEVAYAIQAEGIERGPGTWAVEVLAAYYKDTRGASLVQSHKMLAFMPMGTRTLVALTKAARAWLEEACQISCTEAGKPVMTYGELTTLQERFLGKVPTDQCYSTPWLNTAEIDQRPEAPAEVETPPVAAAAEAFEEDEIPPYLSRLAGGGEPAPAPVLTARDRAFATLDSAARQLAEYVTGLPSRSKAPKAEEVATYVQLVESAREAVRPYLQREA